MKPGMNLRTMAMGLMGGGQLPWIFRDRFSVDLAAGAVNGTLSSDGKATRTVVDAENKLSIASSALTFAGGKASPASGDPGLWYPGHSRTAGRMFLANITKGAVTTVIGTGFDDDTAGAISRSVRLIASSIISIDATLATNAGAYAAGSYTIAVVERPTGYFYFIKGGTFTEWTLLYVDATSTDTTIYPGIANYDSTATFPAVGLVDLPAPFNSDYGLATQQLSGARSALDTFTHEANCLIGFTVTTLPASSDMRVWFRIQTKYTDAWYILFNPDGSFTLYERVGNTPINRGSAGAGTILNGHRVVIVADRTTIKVYTNNVLRITYSSATNFSTKTDAELQTLGVGGAVSDIVSWPRYLSGTAKAILDRAFNELGS